MGDLPCFLKYLLFSINFYPIHSYNIEIVEVSSHTYDTTKISTKKKERYNCRNTADLLGFYLSEEEFLEKKEPLGTNFLTSRTFLLRKRMTPGVCLG